MSPSGEKRIIEQSSLAWDKKKKKTDKTDKGLH
jgi:hypothetical protein